MFNKVQIRNGHGAIAPYDTDIEDTPVPGVLTRFGKINTNPILWDLTSYFEGDSNESELVRPGFTPAGRVLPKRR